MGLWLLRQQQIDKAENLDTTYHLSCVGKTTRFHIHFPYLCLIFKEPSLFQKPPLSTQTNSRLHFIVTTWSNSNKNTNRPALVSFVVRQSRGSINPAFHYHQALILIHVNRHSACQLLTTTIGEDIRFRFINDKS